MSDSLSDFSRSSFTHGGVCHDVYRSGQGPAVIVIAEIPGITPRWRTSPGGCGTWAAR